MEQQLTIIKPGEGLSLRDQMDQFFTQFREVAKTYKSEADAITINGVDDLKGMKAAREKRLEIRTKRLEVEKLHRDKKADALAKGQALDEIKREILSELEPLEKALQEKEDYAEREAKRIKDELFNKRVELLKPYIGDEAKKIQLGELGDMAFEAMLSGYKLQAEAKQVADKKAIEDKAEQIKKDAEARKKQLALQSRINRVSSLGLIYREGTDNVVARYQSYDGVIRVDEVEEFTDQVFESWFIATQKEVEKRKKKDAVDKKKADDEAESNRIKLQKIEDEKKAKAAADRKAKRQPDREKLHALRADILGWTEGSIQVAVLPTMTDEDGKKILDNVKELFKKIGKYLESEIKKLD